MPSYTTSLRLIQPATGEYSGSWGTQVNTGITALVDSSIAGTTSITMTAANYTLTTANGASDESRAMFLVLGGTPGAAREVIVPAVSKLYFVTNSTTGGFAQTVKTSAGSGISVPNGASMTLRCDGTNVVVAQNYFASMTLGSALPVASGGTGAATLTGVLKGNGTSAFTASNVNLTSEVTGTLPVANGGTGAATFTANNVLLGNGTSALQVVAPGTAGNILTSNGTTWASSAPASAVSTISFGTTGLTPSTATSGAVSVAGTLATTNGGTGLTSFTSGGVVYASSTSALATGSGLVFDGTNLGIGGSPVFKLDVFDASAATVRARTTSSGNAILAASTAAGGTAVLELTNAAGSHYIYGGFGGTQNLSFLVAGSEQMRLTSTGLGIGTSSPTVKLDVLGIANFYSGAAGTFSFINVGRTASEARVGVAAATNDFLIGVVAGDSVFYQVGAGNAWYGTAATGSAIFTTNNTERMRLDSSGNLGLGVTPSAWTGSGGKNIEVGATGNALFGSASLTAYISNANFDSSWKYSRTGFASRYEQQDSNHRWFTAPSGTAGNAISFTQAMTLDASGRLCIGATSGTEALNIQRGAGVSGYIEVAGNNNGIGTASVLYGQDSGSNGYYWNRANAPILLGTNNTERARITSGGDFGIGTSSPGSKLDVNGTATFAGGAQTTPVAVTFSATAMTVDCALSNVFATTFTANVTTAPTISSPRNGQTINWFITQDGTGSRTMTWPTSFRWPSGATRTLSTTANSVDLLVATYLSSTGFWYASLSKGFTA